MKLYTLLYLAKNEQNTVNAKSGSFERQLAVYIGCIRLLKHSLKNTPIELEILTNDKAQLVRLIDEPFIPITELTFTKEVPSGIRFYAAHFKLEVFKFLGQQDQYVGLIDSDVICINAMPDCFANCIEKGIALYYDISEQVMPAYGQSQILSEKRTISPGNSLGLWAGGEFLAGPPLFFQELDNEINKVRSIYFEKIHQLHHQGDEFLTSVALENYMLNGKGNVPVQDAGRLNIIGRYWNYPPRHEQKSMQSFMTNFLLHLPSNKKELAALSAEDLPVDKLRSKLRRSLLANIPSNTIKYYLKRMMGRDG